MCFLITGVAGFIGSALAKGLLNNGENVIGLDNLNSYYDVNLKINRLKNIECANQSKKSLWRFENCDIENYEDLRKIFLNINPKQL